jgi:ketosteroid isomerase-like protein
MYHAIVRRRVVALFAAVSKGDARPVLEGLAPHFEHFFLGDHALGGSRFTLEKTRMWYERLYRLLPDISFDLRAIRISGPPWNTLVAVDWLESNSGTDGVRTFTPRSPRRPAGVGQDDLYRNLSRHCRTYDDIAKVVASRCCGSDDPKNRRLVIALPVAM